MEDKEKFEDLYTIFVSQGIKMAKAMAQSVGQDAESISTAMVAIVTRLEDSGKKNGLAFDIKVIFNGAKEILIYLLSVMGVELSEEFVKEIVALMVGKYLKQALESGKMTKAQAEELSRMAQQGKGMISGQMEAANG